MLTVPAVEKKTLVKSLNDFFEKKKTFFWNKAIDSFDVHETLETNTKYSSLFQTKEI